MMSMNAKGNCPSCFNECYLPGDTERNWMNLKMIEFLVDIQTGMVSLAEPALTI
jgi:hypothetical protein